MNTTKLADGTECLLLAEGTRIRHVGHKHLTGRICAIEMCSINGVPNSIPYKVEWDDDAKAKKLLGIFRIYQDHKCIERSPDGAIWRAAAAEAEDRRND